MLINRGENKKKELLERDYNTSNIKHLENLIIYDKYLFLFKINTILNIFNSFIIILIIYCKIKCMALEVMKIQKNLKLNI